MKLQGLWVALGQQRWEFTYRHPRRANPKPETGCWAPKTHRSSTRATNPIWSEATEGLLWHKSDFILMMVMGGMCQNTQYITLCCTWNCHKPNRVLMTPVHHQKHAEDQQYI